MSWLSVLKLLFSATNWVAQFMAEKQLIDAGVAKQVARNNAQVLLKIDAVNKRRAAVKHDADSVQRDPANRDK